MTSRRRRRVAATAVGLCAAVAAGVVIGLPSGAGGPAPGSATAAPPSGQQLPAPAVPAGLPVTPSPAGAPSTPAPAPGLVPWQPPAPSGLTGPVEQVLAAAPATGPVRIVTLAVGADGAPDVVVTTAPDRAHAADAVTRAREVPGAVTVSVDSRVHVADAGVPAPVPVASSGDADAVAVRSTAGPTPSNDTYRSLQWALDTLHAETAWGLHTAAGQTVAVVDTGVDGTHPDLSGILLAGTDVLGQYPDGRSDPQGHGTHCAGIVDAVAGNGIGVAGLAQGAAILPVRVLSADGSGWSSDVATGVIWAADHGATVISMSLGGPVEDANQDAAISYARSRGIVVVAAAGNDQQNGNPVDYPGGSPGVVTVAATDQNDLGAIFSETGPQVDIAAPGVQIASTFPVARNSYAYESGTSMATPYVAAAAALVRAAGPQLTPDQVATVLTSTAADRGAPGRDDVYGAGLLDPVAALQAVASGAVAPVAPWQPTGVTAVAGDRSATVSWTAPADGGSPITSYTVVASPGGATATTTGAATSATVTGLTDGTAYRFTVTATSAVGTGAPSAATAGVTPVARPGAPTGVTATAGRQSARVSWTAPADGGSPITSYTVVADPGGATATTTGATSTTVTGLTSGTAYSFSVTATNAVGAGSPSAAGGPVSPLPATVPDAPLQVTAQPGDRSATVSWTAPADGGSPITSYTVVADPGGATATTTGATTATLTGLTDGTAYTVTVTATNAVGAGAASAAGGAVVPGPDRLDAGQGLSAGQQLLSPNGRYRFVLQADGNAVVYGPGQRPLWYPRTWGNAGAGLVVQPDGNVVVHAASGAVLWHSDTWGHPGAGLVLQDDGNLVLYGDGGRALWFTGWDTAPAGTLFGLQQLTAGQALVSPAGRFTMVVQGDGNVVVHDSAQRALWSSRTWGRPGARLEMQPDGNPVVYSAGRQAAWHPATYGNAGARLVLQDDGNLVVYAAGGRALWSSRYGRTY